MNSIVYKAKPDEAINDRYKVGKSPARKGSIMREQGAKIIADNDREAVEASLLLNVQESVGSPKKRRKIVWRDETDKMN